MVEAFFWLSVLLVSYVYLGYPVLLKILTCKKIYFRMDEDYHPFVTLFIPVYNEETIIEEKISNSLALDYPLDRIEIVVVSDGSADATNSILSTIRHPSVTVHIEKARSGKNACINKHVPRSRGEIIVFSDANSMYQRDAIKRLVRHFFDSRVGCVCGHLKYVDRLTSVAKGEGLYFKYEALLKKMESARGAVVVANGAIYALRKALFRPIPLNTPNDFVHPIEVVSQGHCVLYEGEAVAEEKASASFNEEFERRVRIVSRSYSAYRHYSETHRLITTRHGFYFLSHKLLRWYLPLPLLCIFFVNAFLAVYPFYSWLFLAQIAFYVTAFMGYVFQQRGWRFTFFYIPLYFCLINIAAVIGILRYYFRGGEIIWEHAPGTRRPF